MTETTDRTKTLPAPVERFVLHWGDMGNEWGVNRSVSQIHALLYLSERRLTADETAARRAHRSSSLGRQAEQGGTAMTRALGPKRMRVGFVAEGRRANSGNLLSDLRFRTLIADADWATLPPGTRRRFTQRLAGGNTII